MQIKLKKFQNGGTFPPFLATYNPITVNDVAVDPILQYLSQMGSTAATVSSSTKSTSSGSIDLKDTMSLLKDMRGLTNDVATVSKVLSDQAQRDQLFGTGNPVLQYYKNVELINKVIDSKEAFKDAYDQAKAQGALSEAAISSDGRIVVKTQKGYNLVDPKKALMLQANGQAVIQKNSDLLQDRRNNPQMAFQNGVLDIVQNSISFKSIKDTIDAIANNLGKSSVVQEGYTTKEGNQIRAGIEALKNAGVGSMNGVYKISYHKETQDAQANMAINAIYRNLNDTQKAYLELNSDGTQKGAFGLIKEIVMGRTSSLEELKSDYQKNMDSSGKAISSNTDKSGNPIEDIENDPAIAWALGYGTKSKFPIMGKGRVGIDVVSNSIAMLDNSNKPMSTATLDMLGSGRLGGMLDFNNVSMDGAMITPDTTGRVIVDGGRIYATDLPIDREALAKGTVRPDLGILKKIEQVNTTQLGNLATIPQDKLTLQQMQQINNIYSRNGIPAKYDSNGNLTTNYRRFAMVNGTASEKSFINGEPQFIIETQKASDQARNNYVNNIKTLTDDKKFKLDDGWFSSEDVYQGTIFIPMSSNYVDYYTGSGIKMDTKQLKAQEILQQRRDYLISKYNNPGSLQ